ncbi:MAG: peptidylprolyl isomerase [Burkholderiales bacterium]
MLLLCLPLTQASAQGNVIDMVCFDTNLGEFCVRLFPEDAPQTVANFLKYVNDGDYNNTIFHRSVSNFVLQGGGFSFNQNFGAVEVPKDPPVVNEFNRSNTRGTLAMAKADGNPNSATSEWFINLADNGPAGLNLPGLDSQNGGFTVFAEVITGMNVVDNIARQPTFNLINVLGGAFEDTPLLNFDDQFVASDFITINRAFQTQRDPDAPTANDPFPNLITTAIYSNVAFLMPVQWTDGSLYRMIFIQSTTILPPAYVFTVDTTTIITQTDKGQSRATFDGQYLTIPSVKIPGGIVTDVRLRLTDSRTLEFTLESFNRYTGEEPLP